LQLGERGRHDGIEADGKGNEADRALQQANFAKSQRAEIAIGTAITQDGTPIPIIEPIPNSKT
jgi:hypothetical protein